jgi:hypothetical protein
MRETKRSAPELASAAIEALPPTEELATPPMTSRGTIPEVVTSTQTPAPTASERAYEPLYDKASDSARAETKQSPTAGFEKVTQHGLHAADAPSTIALPQAAQQGLQGEWDASAAEHHKKEHGGNLVRNKDGSYAWRTTHGPANAGVFIPDEDDVGKGQKLVGFGHTHGYESGNEDVSFSDADISSIVDESQPINLLQSGKTQFLIARTAEFEAMIKDLDDDQLADLRAKIEKCWQNNYNTKGTIQERAERATEVTCRAFKLAYYRGQGGTLKRVV